MDAAPPPDPPAYVYSAADIRPVQSREIQLCEKASQTDWLYLGGAFAGTVGSVMLDSYYLKELDAPQRLLGPVAVGLFWGGFLGGGYLSLPKCDPLFAYGPPPEGNVRLQWPIATAIALIAAATAPALDYTFLGPVKADWPVPERSARIFIAMGAGITGSLLPYLLPPRTWSAAKEIEKIRLGPAPTIDGRLGGPYVSYGFLF